MVEDNSPIERVDLTNCDREPIHIPGAILPHGAMLVVEEASLEILQVAGDTSGLIGCSAASLLGRTLDEFLNPDQITRVRSLSLSSDLVKPRHLLDPIFRVRPDRKVDVSLHRGNGNLIFEYEEADPTDPHSVDPLSCVQDMLDGLDACVSLHDFCQAAAERVRKVTGYDRVMVYRFQPDGSGWVFAEACNDALEPFLDLHYPASDIPLQARALYLQNWLRLIVEVDYAAAPLTPALNPRTGAPLDMSHATLRDVSPIHREYLRNMGVGASMSISIIVEGRLWGLIACHHRTSKRIPRHLRAICELFGAMFSLQLEANERSASLRARVGGRTLLHDIVTSLVENPDYGDGLFSQAARLTEYIDAGGLALRVSGKGGLAIKVNSGIRMVGETPDESQIAALTDWLSGEMKMGEGVFSTDRLAELWPPAANFTAVGSGLLALSISVEPRDFILWFRPEVVQTVSWAGDPAKPVHVGEHGHRLTPRQSFEAWTEEVRGRATPWSAGDDELATDLRLSLLDIVLRRIDAAARERERALEKERLLMHELDHRVKNTLANIQAMVSQTSRSASSLLDFTRGLEQRILSMSKAHSLLTDSRWTGASICKLVAQELAPYRQVDQFDIGGPEIILSAKASLALSLAVHELATNAAKYGALSVAGGRIAVRWENRPLGGIEVFWTESGGPIVTSPARRGFGSTLIEQALAYETGGATTLVFEPSGVRCAIVLPATEVVSAEREMATDREPSVQQPEVDQTPSEAKLRVLVVEDSALVTMMIGGMLEDMGWEMVGPAMRVADALELATSAEIDVSLLDVNLGGAMSWPVAEQLRSRGVPFAFTTGYDAGSMIPKEFSDAPVVQKPFTEEMLQQCLLAMAGAKLGRAN